MVESTDCLTSGQRIATLFTHCKLFKTLFTKTKQMPLISRSLVLGFQRIVELQCQLIPRENDKIQPRTAVLHCNLYNDNWMTFPLKPHPHQQRSNTVECYKSNDSFYKVECCFNIAAGFGNNFKEISSFRQSRNKLNIFNLFRNRQHCCPKKRHQCRSNI